MTELSNYVARHLTLEKSNLTSNTYKPVIIITGPSGVGKSSIIFNLLNSSSLPDLEFFISSTTREPRQKEINGVHYHFVRKEAFVKTQEENGFLESEEVYKGCFYGSSIREYNRIWDGHHIPLMDIDVKGAMNVSAKLQDNALVILVRPKSKKDLELMLRERKTESEENIQKRLKRVSEELKLGAYFSNVVVNRKDHLQEAIDQCRSFINQFNGYLNRGKILTNA